MPDPVLDEQPPLPFAAAVAYAEQVSAWSRGPLPAGVAAWHGLAYGPHPQQRFDVFAPAAAPRSTVGAPLLVFWHGGGWTNGYREWVHFMAGPVCALGLVLVTPSYRLAPRHRLDAAFDDCAALLRMLRGNAADWGADAARLYLAGHSAGGHLAALAALRLPGARGCLAVSGILDLHHPAPPPGSLEERVYTQVLAEREHDATLSPLHWTRGNRVPFDLSCGERDSERVLRSNHRMAALLASQGAPVQLNVLPGHDHFATHTALADAGNPWYRRLAVMVEAPESAP